MGAVKLRLEEFNSFRMISIAMSNFVMVDRWNKGRLQKRGTKLV